MNDATLVTQVPVHQRAAAVAVSSPTPTRNPKPKSRKKSTNHRNWESTFGRHTARWHPCSVVESIGKEGKPILLLILIGVSASVLDYLVDAAVFGLGLAKKKLVSLDVLSSSPYAVFAAWSAFTVVVATLACVWTATIDPRAVGSGIPEMKTILSCDLRDEAERYLRARTLLAKAGGLALALGSGISVGREGPFVHTASILAHRLMKHVAFFRRIYTNDILRRHMYNAACAVGVASTFRAPIGGVLFSIEVTSTVFMVSNYWRAFVAALSGSIARQIVGLLSESTLATYHPMFPTAFDVQSFAYAEYVAFAALGLLMGVVGALYVVLASAFKRWWNTRSATHPLLAGVLLLAPVCVLLYLPGPVGRSSSWDVLTDLFSSKALTRSHWSRDAVFPSVLAVLPLTALCRVAATILSTALLLPAGDFIPTFTAGAMLGRLAGELLALSCPSWGVVPGGYALVGGAALVASATQTVSVAVIAMEFTGQFVYLNPLLLAVLLASSVGSALSVSVYDSAILSKGLTYLPMLRVNRFNGVRARDVMDADIPLLTATTSVTKLHTALALEPTRSIPVVSDAYARVLFGCAARRDVDAFLLRLLERQRATDTPQQSATTARSTGNTHSGKASELRRGSSPALLLSSTDADLVIGSAETREQRKHVSRASLQMLPSGTTGNVDANADNDDDDDADDVRLFSDSEIDDRNGEDEGDSLHVDSSVLQVDAETPITKVHLLFEMIKCSRIWVTRRGRLVGRIDRARLASKIAALETRNASAV